MTLRQGYTILLLAMVVFLALVAEPILSAPIVALRSDNLPNEPDIKVWASPMTKDARYVVLTGNLNTDLWKSSWKDIEFRLDFDPGYNIESYTVITTTSKRAKDRFETESFERKAKMETRTQIIINDLSWPPSRDDFVGTTTRSFGVVLKIESLASSVYSFTIRESSYFRFTADSEIKQLIPYTKFPFAETIGKLKTTFQKTGPEQGSAVHSELKFDTALKWSRLTTKNDLIYYNRLNTTKFVTEVLPDPQTGVLTVDCLVNNNWEKMTLGQDMKHLVIKMKDVQHLRSSLNIRCKPDQLKVLYPLGQATPTFFALEVRDEAGVAWVATDGRTEKKKPFKVQPGVVVVILIVLVILVTILLKVFKVGCFKPKAAADDDLTLLNSEVGNGDESYQQF